MNTIVSAEYLDTVCEGCLSQERPDLTTEVTADVKKMYYEILNIAVEVSDLKRKKLGDTYFFFFFFLF